MTNYYSIDPNPVNKRGVKPNSYGEKILSLLKKYQGQKPELSEEEIIIFVESEYSVSKRGSIKSALERLWTRGFLNVRKS